MSKSAAPKPTPPSVSSGDDSSLSPKNPLNNQETDSQKRMFVVMALNMSWQLAVVMLVPIIGGVELDKAMHTKQVWTFVGLGLALLGSGVVIWHAVQVAGRVPVPKLTEAQKREIKKQYEEEDEE